MLIGVNFAQNEVMLNHTFNLKEPSANKDTIVFLRARFSEEDKYLKYSTGEVINPKLWDFKTRMPLAIAGRTLEAVKNREIATQLSRYSEEFYKAVSELKLHDMQISIEAVRQKLDLVFKKTASKKSLFDVYDLFIEERKQLGKVSSRAIEKDLHIKKLLVEFMQVSGYTVTFNRMDKSF